MEYQRKQPTRPRIRVFITEPFTHPLLITDSGSVHYLNTVMRVKVGDSINIFNPSWGEWQGRVTAISKNSITIEPNLKVKEPILSISGKLILAAALAKTFDITVQKATELGADIIQPLITDRTTCRGTNLERLHKISIEATEQSGRLAPAVIQEPVPLRDLLSTLTNNNQHQKIIVLSLNGQHTLGDIFSSRDSQDHSVTIMIGPEGGWSSAEEDLFAEMEQRGILSTAQLGKNTLRTETAAIAAISIYNNLSGIW